MIETLNGWVQNNEILFYFILFGYCAVKGSILPVLAGILVASQSLHAVPSVIAMFLGGVLGEAIRFAVGRRYGDALFEKLPKRLGKWLGKGVLLFEHFDSLYILLCRYPNGIRSIGSLPVGLGTMPWPRFMMFNLLSIGLWVGIYFALGYGFGASMSELLERNLALLSPVLLLVFVGGGWFAMRRIDRLEQQAERAIK